MDWTAVDAIEIATIGRDREQPVATGYDDVERMDGLDPEGYDIVSHSVYVHRPGIGATCIADCWDRETAQRLGQALGQTLGVPVDDYTLAVAVDA